MTAPSPVPAPRDARPSSSPVDRAARGPALPPDFLVRSHRAFHDVEQAPLAADQYLEAAGHPRADAYRYCRRFFDRLPFAAHAGTRFVAVRHPDSYVELGTPHLGLSTSPGRFHQLGEVRPADVDAWMAYCALAAEAGFPPATAPTVHCGTWYVRTDDVAHVLALRGMGGRLRAGMVSVPCTSLESWCRVAAWVVAQFGDCLIGDTPALPALVASHAHVAHVAQAVVAEATTTLPEWDRLSGVVIRTPPRAVPVLDACRRHVPARPQPDAAAGARVAVTALLTWLDGGVPWTTIAPLIRRFVSPATFAGLTAWYTAG